MVDRCECRFAKTVWSPNSSDSGGSTGLKFNKTGGSSSIGALLINFREEATTCCLIIASHAAATEPLSLSLSLLSVSISMHASKIDDFSRCTGLDTGTKEFRDRFHSFHPSGQPFRGSKIYRQLPPFRPKPIPIDGCRHSIQIFDNVYPYSVASFCPTSIDPMTRYSLLFIE